MFQSCHAQYNFTLYLYYLYKIYLSRNQKRIFSEIQDSIDSFQALVKYISFVIISRVILLNPSRPDAGSAVNKIR